MIPSYSLAPVFGISISEQRKIYFNHRNTLISLLSNTLFIIFIKAMNITLQLQGKLVPAAEMRPAGQGMVLGVQVLEMGVFAGILIGAFAGYLFNRYSSKQFNGVMAIYSGHCFVTILAIPSAILLGFVMSAVWPYAQHGISALAFAIKGAGPFGVAIYGFLERILIPTGLHHLVYIAKRLNFDYII